MTGITTPVFGKRKNPKAASVSRSSVKELAKQPSMSLPQRSLDLEDSTYNPVQVRNSLLAAVLTGLVVGCGLALLNFLGIGNTFVAFAVLIKKGPEAMAVLPFMVLLGLMGGGRAAGTSLLLAHPVLKRFRQTSHLAYVIGGFAAASAYSALLFILWGAPPIYGWLIDCLAGGVGGFFYRIFAGTRQGDLT